MAKYKRLQERFLQPAKTKEILSSAKKAQKTLLFDDKRTLFLATGRSKQRQHRFVRSFSLICKKVYTSYPLQSIFSGSNISHLERFVNRIDPRLPHCRVVLSSKTLPPVWRCGFYRQQRLQLNAKQLAGVLACPIEQIL